MSKVFVKSLKDTRKGKRVILPCGVVEFNENCVAELDEEQLDDFSIEDLEAHSLEVVEDESGESLDDEPDEPEVPKLTRNKMNKLGLEELQEMAIEAELPDGEWEELGVTKLRDYLYDKLNSSESE